MEWKKEYELGVELIDNQHKRLISLVNDYYNHLADKKINSFKEIGDILKYLIGYTNYHFHAEENLMEEIGYPELDDHKLKHRELIVKIKEILFKMKNKESYTRIEFYYFLMDWINEHILVTDKKIAAYYEGLAERVKPLKVELSQPESVLDVVQTNLKRMDNLQELGEINNEEKSIQRSIFLQEYYQCFLLNQPTLYYNVLLSVKLLFERSLILNSEIKLILSSIIINTEEDEEKIKNSGIYNQIQGISKELHSLINL